MKNRKIGLLSFSFIVLDKQIFKLIIATMLGSQMLVMFPGWNDRLRTTYAIDFWCHETTGNIFHRTKNQLYTVGRHFI